MGNPAYIHAMPRLLLYHDFASAYSRVALSMGIQAARAAGVVLDPVPFERFPEPAPLPSPVEAFGAELEGAAALAADHGLPVSLPPMVPRTRKAHEAVAFARQHDLALPMAEAIYDALWRGGEDIARVDVLAGLGEGVGVDPGALHVALGVDVYTEDVVRVQALAERDGIGGVPTFRYGDALATGLLPFTELMAWIEALATGPSNGSP
jgi:predicted DsbA family dithiol-disulfide isomerase